MIHFSWANPNLLEAQNFSNVKFKKCCKYTEIFDSSSYECVPRKIKHQMIEKLNSSVFPPTSRDNHCIKGKIFNISLGRVRDDN